MPRLNDIVIRRILGQNTADAHLTMPPDHCRSAFNVEFINTGIGRKRRGSSKAEFALTTPAWSDTLYHGVMLLDSVDVSEAVMLVIGPTAGNPAMGIADDAASFAAVTVDDTINDATSRARWIQSAQLNGKMFYAYDNTGSVNRLHVYDPVEGRLRRVGLAKPAAPSVADQGSGSYGANLRYYKVAYTVQSGGVTVRRSELSASQSFTPNGTSLSARVTKPAAISEDETHWELYGSEDDDIYFLLATTVVGTTTYDDTTNPDSYSGDAPPLVGTNIPPPSARMILATDSRLLMAGAWETAKGDSWTPANDTVWYTPVLGTGVGDDERVPDISGVVSNKLVFSEPIKMIAGPLDGDVYVFSALRCWRLVPTGVASNPYIVVPFANIGARSSKGWDIGIDETGRAALYFMSNEGPYRIVGRRLQDLRQDMLDVWASDYSPAAIVAPNAIVRFYPNKQQVFFWYGTLIPSTLVVFHVAHGTPDERGNVRNGWVTWTANGTTGFDDAHEVFLFPGNGWSGGAMTGILKLFVCTGTSSNPKLLIMDKGTIDHADSTGWGDQTFQAYLDSQHYAPWGLGRTGQIVEDPYVYAKTQSGVTLTLTVDRDFSAETSTSTALLTQAGSETHKRVKFEGTHGADMEVFQFRVGDAAAAAGTWDIDAMVIPVSATGRDGVPD